MPGYINKYWEILYYLINIETKLSTANYLQNQLVIKVMDITLIERWNGTIPNLKDIAVFGFKVYSHILKALRRKLDVKAKELRFTCFVDAKGFRSIGPSYG